MTLLEIMVLILLVEHTCFNVYALVQRKKHIESDENLKLWRESFDSMARAYDNAGLVWEKLNETLKRGLIK